MMGFFSSLCPVRSPNFLLTLYIDPAANAKANGSRIVFDVVQK